MRIPSIVAIVITLWFAAPAHAQTAPGGPSYDTLVSNARGLAKSGKYADAINVCEQAIARSSTRYEAYVAAASVYAAQALPDDAMAMLQQALVRAPQAKKASVRDAISFIRQQLGDVSGANTGIAYLDSQRVISESALGKHYSAQVNAEWAKNRTSWEAKNKEVQALQQRIAQVAGVTKDQPLNQMKTGLARLQSELKQIETKMYADNDAIQGRLTQEFQARLAPVLNEIAAAQKLRIVFNTENLIWVDPATDLTAQVIRALDAKGTK